ncbi:MAG: hypothetical protein AAF745_17535, partial [Planctomycetota bacterium]
AEMIGVLAPECEYHEEVAKPEYAIAGIRVRIGVRVHGIQIVYQRMIDNQLDPNDQYTSPWYGGRDGEPGQLVGCRGYLVRGLRCSSYVDVNRIALLTD